jgi:hypothetical protein
MASGFSFARPKSRSFAPRLGEHDVARLEIAMDHSLPVCPIEGVGDLSGVLEQQREWQRLTTHSLRKGLAFEVLHYQEVGAVLMADVVKGADVSMREFGDTSRLTLKALA